MSKPGAAAAKRHGWRTRPSTAAFRAHVRERDPDRYAALLEDFRAKTAAALPSSDAAFMPGLAKGHARFVETAIAFLEADPWFFRSGYEKQKIIQHLKRAPSQRERQRMRLARVVLEAIDGRDRMEFRHFGRLACGIWSDFLDAEVAAAHAEPRCRHPPPRHLGRRSRHLGGQGVANRRA